MSGQKELRYEGKGWKFAMRPGNSGVSAVPAKLEKE
jgi:hypothetical protein